MNLKSETAALISISLALVVGVLGVIAAFFSSGTPTVNADQQAPIAVASGYAEGAPEKDNDNDGYDAPWHQGNRELPRVPHWTKEEFDKYIQNKTKAEIHDEFGKPDAVNDDSDSWHYHDIDVQDATAGTWVSGLSIRFAGIDDKTDFSVDVRYN